MLSLQNWKKRLVGNLSMKVKIKIIGLILGRPVRGLINVDISSRLALGEV